MTEEGKEGREVERKRGREGGKGSREEERKGRRERTVGGIGKQIQGKTLTLSGENGYKETERCVIDREEKNGSEERLTEMTGRERKGRDARNTVISLPRLVQEEITS